MKQLRHQFLDEVLAALTSIAKCPLACQIVYKDTWRFLIHRFSFGIYYRVENDVIVIVAVMHGSRNPRRW